MADNANQVAPKPWTKGWKAPWRGQWGPLGDGHSSLAHLVKQIQRELHKEYLAKSPTDKRRLERAAEFMALAVQVRDGIGLEHSATTRKLAAMTTMAERILDKLTKRDTKPLTAEQERKRFERDLKRQSKGQS